jgi:hypothetical protein
LHPTLKVFPSRRSLRKHVAILPVTSSEFPGRQTPSNLLVFSGLRPENRGGGGQSWWSQPSNSAICSPKYPAKPTFQYPQMSRITPPEDSLRIIRTPYNIRHAYERQRPATQQKIGKHFFDTRPSDSSRIYRERSAIAGESNRPQGVSGDCHSPFSRLGICLWNLPTRER